MKGKLIKDFFKEILKRRGSISLKAFGGSMRPLIRSGDFLTIRPIDSDSLEIGGIFAFRKESASNITIAHRLVDKKGSFLITKGDAYIRPDSSVLQEELLGKVIKIEREGRTIEIEKFFYIWIGKFIAYISLHYPRILLIVIKFVCRLQKIKEIMTPALISGLAISKRKSLLNLKNGVDIVNQIAENKNQR